MAPKGKRKLSELLQREEGRKQRLKLENGTALLNLRRERAAIDKAKDEKEAYLAAKRAGDLRERPSYYPTYAPGNSTGSNRTDTPKGGTVKPAVESWPEPIDGSQTNGCSRLSSSSSIRLSPPRADDWRRILAYESIGVTSEDLDRDRKERHQEKAKALIETYERFNFDSVETVGSGNVTDGNAVQGRAKNAKNRLAGSHTHMRPQPVSISGPVGGASITHATESEPLRNTCPIIKAEPVDDGAAGPRDVTAIGDLVELDEDDVINPYSPDPSPPLKIGEDKQAMDQLLKEAFQYVDRLVDLSWGWTNKC